MTVLRLLPPALAALVLAAHFYRAGNLVLAGAALVLVGLLFVPRAWAARVVQVGLVAGAVEWLLTLWRLVEMRQAMGQPYARLAAILAVVALFTALSALSFRPRARYRRHSPDGGERLS